MPKVNIYEAKTRLSELVEAAHRGKTFVIAKAGTPMAKLVPLSEGPRRTVRYGLMKGKIKVAADFDAPLPESMLRLFERDSEP